MPTLSIITVCRNEAACIRKTAESVAGQSCQDFEWIVQDGGSTDGTLDILGEYRTRMARFRSGPDDGIYDAMNMAAALATGSYLLFLNGGDALADSQVVGDMLSYGSPEGNDILVGDCLCLWRDGRPPRRKSHAWLDMHSLYRWAINHQSAFIGRDVFARFGPYDTSFRIAGDRDFFVRAMLGGAVFRSIPRLVAEYDMEGMSARSKHDHSMQLELKRIRRRYTLGYRIRRMLNDAYVSFRKHHCNVAST